MGLTVSRVCVCGVCGGGPCPSHQPLTSLLLLLLLLPPPPLLLLLRLLLLLFFLLLLLLLLRSRHPGPEQTQTGARR